MKLALIGAGRMGAYHASLLSEIAAEVLINDAIADRADAVAAEYPNARAVGLDEAFTHANGVVIASATDTHAALLHRAAEAGVTAFCEKPIALDLASTRSVVDAIEAARVVVQMGFQRRYDPAITAIKERISSGDLGFPYLVRSQTHDPAPPPLDYIPVSGGIFKDCLIHDIDVVRFVTGQEVESVSAFGAVLGFEEFRDLGDVDSATVVMTMDGGTLAQLSGLRHDPVGYDVRLEVFGSKTSMAAGWSQRTPIVSAEPGVASPSDPITTFWDRFEAAYRAELEAFLRVIEGTEAPAAGPRDALQDLRVAEACAVSMREGRPVRVEEIE